MMMPTTVRPPSSGTDTTVVATSGDPVQQEVSSDVSGDLAQQGVTSDVTLLVDFVIKTCHKLLRWRV